MAFTLDQVVPWGRSYDEYRAMFALSDADLKKHILGCGDGPASFNAELTRNGGTIISVDPLYSFSAEEIQSRIDETFATVLEQTRKNRNNFIWKQIRDIDELQQIRSSAMNIFLDDFREGIGRYLPGELPSLPLTDNSFDLALCSHLLFLYSEQLSADFHIQSLIELCRVAPDVRVFPLLELNAQKSRHLEKVVSSLKNEGIECRIEHVSYEFQKGGFEMLHCIKHENFMNSLTHQPDLTIDGRKEN